MKSSSIFLNPLHAEINCKIEGGASLMRGADRENVRIRKCFFSPPSFHSEERAIAEAVFLLVE